MNDTLHGTPATSYTRRRQTHKRKNGFAILFFVTIFLFSMVAGCLFYLYLRYAPLPPSNAANASAVLTTDGTVLTDLFKGGHNRLKVPLQDIPATLREATISVEDDKFYSHHGFDFYGIARALYVNIKSGQIKEGGSTITQQLAKNLYFNTQDRTFTRKIKEAVRTMQLEINYSKDQILEQYLNYIYYGEGAYGAEAAAQTYFGKPVQNLDLAESAMLAGLPKGPSIYSPLSDEKKAKERQRIVLDAMVNQGYITKQQADEAYQEPLQYATQHTMNAKAPHFISLAVADAKDALGIQENELVLGGYKITTTLDPAMQKAAEDAVAKYLPKGDLEVALVAIDPKTGEIKAMIGGRNFRDPGLNHVLAKRQPGSSFKPIVYLTALQNGFTPATRIKSEPTTIQYGPNGEKTYEVKNYENQYVNDYIDMRTAISRSDNVYAVTAQMDIGSEKVVDMARKLGIESPLQPYPSLALGSFPVSPLEMARAYAILANGGQKVQIHAVSSIENAYNKNVYQYQNTAEPVTDPKLAFILTDLLKGVFEPGGTASRVASMVDRPVAGKTGTTDTDAWMIGYTPDLVTAVWIGYDKDRLLSPVESHLAAPIWAEFMKSALSQQAKRDFPKPEGVVQLNIDPTTGQLATPNCPAQHPEYFVAGTEPTEECSEHPISIPGKIKKQLESGGSTLHKVWDYLRGANKSP